MDQNEFNDLLRIQRLMASRIIQEASVDNKIKLLDLINKLITDRNRKVHREAVILEAQAEGFNEQEADRLIDELIDDGLLVEPEQGFLKRG
jgi:DNA replicative helicase MCM subunit Mcm2 (Cdc46/Mcm family)